MRQRNITILELSNILKIQPTFKQGIMTVDLVNSIIIQGLNLCNRNTVYRSILSYATSDRFIESINSNDAIKALLVTKSCYDNIVNSLRNGMIYFITELPEHTFYDLHNYLWNSTEFYNHYDSEPIIGVNCNIHKSVVIENGVVIKDRVTIGPNSVIRSGSVIESDTYIGCCSVIGSEGFQAIRGYQKSVKHVGGTHIGFNVWIGDNTTIGNEAFEGCSEIGDNTKISNHVHIAHCCKIGKNCVITASVLMMGSVKIDDNVWLAPNSVLMNKVVVKQDAFVGTMSLVTRPVSEGITVVGIPAKEWTKK